MRGARRPACRRCCAASMPSSFSRSASRTSARNSCVSFDAGDGIARRRQREVARRRLRRGSGSSPPRSGSVGDLALRGEVRARGRRRRVTSRTPRAAAPCDRAEQRARSRRGLIAGASAPPAPASAPGTAPCRPSIPAAARAGRAPRRTPITSRLCGCSPARRGEHALRLALRRRPCARRGTCACSSRASSASSSPARGVRCAWCSSTSADHRSSPRASGTTWASVSRAPARAARLGGRLHGRRRGVAEVERGDDVGDGEHGAGRVLAHDRRSPPAAPRASA